MLSDKVKKILVIVFAGLFCVSVIGLALLGFTQPILSGLLVGVMAVLAAVSAVVAIIIKFLKG